ncbi:MAG: AHH domain-containing protein [Lewinellaceae bacterium]|nr:AHH domain-containing protein [Lewinellaceae bacterium]
MLNITNPNHEAHHIIPWDLSNRNIVQKAADSKSVPYHMNHHKNGMELEKYRIDTNPNGTHANHPQYNNQVLSKMDNLWEALETHYGVGNVPANVASTKLIQLQNSIANVITSYPTTKINLLDLSSVPIPVVP